MSDKALILDSDWLVFIDGVQVPHQGINLQFGRNSLSSCSIDLEPDILLTELRPQAVVSVWAKERFPDSIQRRPASPEDAAQDQYYLYWEGLLAGHSYQKSPTSRMFRIRCESIFSPWTRTQSFMFGIGAYSKSTVLSGSTAVTPGDSTLGDTFSMAALSGRFVGGSPDAPFSQRIEETIGFLSAGNAVLRLQTDRYSLLDRMVSLDDRIYQSLLAPTAANLFEDGATALAETSTVFGVVNHFQRYGFYSSYEIPAPVSRPMAAESTRTDGPLGLDSKYAFSRKYQLNQLAFLPELYFAPPPPCNLIFPDHIRSLSVGRDFYAEPTRALVRDPFKDRSQYIFHLAPAAILRRVSNSEREKMTAAEVFAQTTRALRPSDSGGTDSIYRQTTPKGEVDLFSTILDSEIEKGIVAKVDAYRFETAAAFAAQTSGSKAGDNNAYSQLLTEVINYRYRLDRFARQGTVDIGGHRDVVPGFSCAIFDEDISYYGFVESVNLSVDPLGTETTTLSLSKLRPIREIDVAQFDDVRDKIAGEYALQEELIGELMVVALLDDWSDSRIRAEVMMIESETAFRIEAGLQRFEDSLDTPIPPSFLNKDLSTAEGLDDVYGSLLGCQPLYTSSYARDNAFDFATELLAQTNQAAQFESMVLQATTSNTLNNIFRMTSGFRNSGQLVTADSWQNVRDRKDAIGQTTFEWATRNFTKRERYRLRDYCNYNTLKLLTQYSDAPNSAPFYVMQPAELSQPPGPLPAGLAAAAAGGWDNTLFSKLVMPELTKEDPVIADLRERSPDYFKTFMRQALVIQYAQRHFGSRAFNGS